MHTTHESYLSSIHYELGAKVPIAETGDPSVLSQLDKLEREGIRHCRVATESPVQLAAACATRTLGTTTAGSVVYCTNTPRRPSVSAELWQFLDQLDQPPAESMVVSGSACGNLGPGLHAARGLLAMDPSQAVLLTTADCHNADRRYVGLGAVLSDGAASCLVRSSLVEPGFRIAAAVANKGPDPGDPVAAAAADVGQALAEVMGAALRTAGITPADCRYLVTGNSGNTSRRFLAAMVGIPSARTYSARLSDVAHCYAADQLVSLASITETGAIDPGEFVLLTASGERTRWSLVMQYVEP